MDCLHCRPLLSPLLDDELPAEQAAAVRAHLQQCDSCSAGLSVLQALQAGLRTHPPALPDLAPLAARVRAGLPAPAQATSRPRGPAWLWPALGTGVVAALAASALTLLLAHPETEAGLEDVASASFLRATQLSAGQRQGLASTDPLQVRAWLQQQLGRAVPVPAAAPPGFALSGARVDYLYRQTVATLVYQQGAQQGAPQVEVYLWPQGQEPALQASADEDGLRIRFWSRGGLHRCAVTALDAGTLARFVAGFNA